MDRRGERSTPGVQSQVGEGSQRTASRIDQEILGEESGAVQSGEATSGTDPERSTRVSKQRTYPARNNAAEMRRLFLAIDDYI